MDLDYEEVLNELKSRLNVTDLNLNRLGFIGFIVELIANFRKDAKFYYDYLFNEAFPVSANELENLFFHSFLFGYQPELAKPAKVNGNFKLNEIDNLINPQATHTEIIFDQINFELNGIPYSSFANYKIVIKKTDNQYQFLVYVQTKENQFNVYPVLVSNPRIPILDLYQTKKEELTFNLPVYGYGTYYPWLIDLENDYLNDLKIFVRENDKTEFIEFKTSNNKFSAPPNSEIIFYSITSNNELKLEFGSGIRGKHIPLAEVKVEIYKTKGEAGNINANKLSGFGGTVIHYNGGSVISTQKIQNLFDIEITNAVGGSNPNQKENLRKNLLNYIQSRENLVSNTDFNNLIKKYTSGGSFLFKKLGIFENQITLYLKLNTKLKQPALTNCINILQNNFNQKTFLINGKEYVKPFFYIFNEFTKQYDGYIFFKSRILYPTEIYYQDNKAPIFLVLNYNPETKTSSFYFSRTDLKELPNTKLQVICQELNITNLELQFNQSYTIQGYIENGVVFRVNYLNNVYIFDSVKNCFNLSDVHNIKTHKNYCIDVPVIEKKEFELNENYYLETILNLIYNNKQIRENRMVTDDFQFRFLNSTFIERNYLKKLTKQNLDFHLQFPILLKMELQFHDYVRDIDKIIEDIREDVADYIVNNTGSFINIYKTKFIDIAHNYPEIKYVKVEITDSNQNQIENIESIPDSLLHKVLTKTEYLNYTPIHWWFDLNKIVIDVIQRK